MNALSRFVLQSPHRLVWPIATYPGARLAGVSVKAIATDARAQVAAVTALHARYQTSVVMTAMDLSVEAEAFGCPVRFADDEVPTVIAPRVSDRSMAEALPVPDAGVGRTRVSLETVAQLKKLPDAPRVLGGLIGPFSLAARLFGVGEALELTTDDPELMHLLLEKATRFLFTHVQAFKDAGADGVIVAEPTAGLVSPRALRTFSSAYVRRLAGLADEAFALVLHNCGARLAHLAAVLDAGATMYHFGAPMHLVAALAQVPPDTVLWGNLDPAAAFCQGDREGIVNLAGRLLEATRLHANFVLSSGCDLPPDTRLENLDAFCGVVRRGQVS